jgi:hypothetical protein
VRDDFVGRIAGVDRWLKDLYALPRNFRTPQAANQLFTFS